MVFSSLPFLLLFLPILLLLYFVWNNVHWRNAVLVCASLFFYAWGEPVWILAMLASTAINYGCAYAVDRQERPAVRRVFLVIGVVASLCMLAYCKYASFLVNSFTSLFGLAYRMPEQHLPIGISFYTFQILTYLVDVYRKKAPVQKNPARLLLYISCFPQLIAGPIVQYADVAGMLGERMTTVDDFSAGMKRFVLGLGKKVVLANLCGEMLEAVLAGTEMSFVGAWVAAILYPMQLYFDFSAYSDMAIGIGRVLGFRYKENFDYPFISHSMTEFWHRWHISLGLFFRDYLYYPLGGSRRGPARAVLNLGIVWVLTGLWHGASWNFVLWGVYDFAILVLERFVLKKALARMPKVLSALYVTIVFAIGCVIVYHTDIAAGWANLLAMFGMCADRTGLHAVALIDATTIAVLKTYTVFPLLAAVCCFPIVPALRRLFSRTPRLERAGSALGLVALTAVLALSLLLLIGQSYNPFIYFRF